MAKETEPKVIKRRGIVTAQAVNRKKFSHQDAKPCGLFLAHLEEINIQDVDFSENNAGAPSFSGLKVPRISFVFCTNEENPSDRKYYTHSFLAVESTVKTAPGGDNAYQVDTILSYFNHLIDVYYCKGVSIAEKLTPEQQEKLTLPIEDYDYDKNEYLLVEPEDVIKGWKQLFENVKEFMETGNDGKPVYKNKDGKSYPVWLKLLRYIKTGKGKNKKWNEVNNGELGLPRFVGEGVIELFRAQTPPSMRINYITERLEPMVIQEDKPTTKMPVVPGGVSVETPGSFAGEAPFPADMNNYEDPF